MIQGHWRTAVDESIILIIPLRFTSIISPERKNKTLAFAKILQERLKQFKQSQIILANREIRVVFVSIRLNASSRKF